jgi:hypothetical protein
MEKNINNKDQGTLHKLITEFTHLGLRLWVRFKTRDNSINAQICFFYNEFMTHCSNTSVIVKIGTASTVNFSKSHPVSVSLNFLPNLNAKFSFSTVSSYATAVFQHLLTVVFQHQHMLQPCFSICYSRVSASTTAVFQHLLQQCFSIYYSSVSASTTVFQHLLQQCFSILLSALCFSLCYSPVFQHKLQRCFSI